MSLLWFIHSIVYAEQLGTIEPTARLPLSLDEGLAVTENSVVSEKDFSVLVEQKIEKEVAQRLELPQKDVSVEYLGLGNGRKCNGADFISIRIPQSEEFRGPVFVSVEGKKDNQTCGQWNLRIKMEIWEDVDVASQTIQIGEDIITVKKRMRRDQLRFNVATDLENKIARVPIDKEDVILASQIREKPDRLRGSQVNVIYKSGNLEIRAEGRLMMDAMIGDEVKVSSQTTNSVLHGILKTDGNVYIEGKK